MRVQASPLGSGCWHPAVVGIGWGGQRAAHLLSLFLPFLFCFVSLLSVHAEEDVREVVQDGAPFELGSSEGPPTPHYTLSEIQEALETWWPASSVFDFDAAYEAAKKKARRPLGVWGVEVEDRRELLRLLNLEMERGPPDSILGYLVMYVTGPSKPVTLLSVTLSPPPAHQLRAPKNRRGAPTKKRGPLSKIEGPLSNPLGASKVKGFYRRGSFGEGGPQKGALR
ncbi:hypothetical protein Emag_007104 [Eimeria magna]